MIIIVVGIIIIGIICMCVFCGGYVLCICGYFIDG